MNLDNTTLLYLGIFVFFFVIVILSIFVFMKDEDEKDNDKKDIQNTLFNFLSWGLFEGS